MENDDFGRSNWETVVSESLIAEVADIGVSFGSPPGAKPAFAVAAPSPVAAPTGLHPPPPARLFVILESDASPASPADDVCDLLISTALFAKAVMQLDRDDSSRQREAQCFDALAALKRHLRRVAWSRALE